MSWYSKQIGMSDTDLIKMYQSPVHKFAKLTRMSMGQFTVRYMSLSLKAFSKLCLRMRLESTATFCKSQRKLTTPISSVIES